MGSKNGSFVFYRSFYEAGAALSDEDFGRVARALCAYAFDGAETAESGRGGTIGNVIYVMAQPLLDANRAKRESGKKGGRPKKGAKPAAKPGAEEQPAAGESPASAQQAEAPEKAAEPVQEQAQGSAETPPAPSPAIAWLSAHGYVYDDETLSRIEARSNGLDAESYLSFCEAKVLAAYPRKSAAEKRLLMKNALLTWNNLRPDFTAQVAAASAQKAAEPPKTCPECAKMLERGAGNTYRCRCGFYSLDGGVWTWERHIDDIPLSAKALMLQKAQDAPVPPQPAPSPVQANRGNTPPEFDIF